MGATIVDALDTLISWDFMMNSEMGKNGLKTNPDLCVW